MNIHVIKIGNYYNDNMINDDDDINAFGKMI